MSVPRFRVRTLMIVVAILAILLATVPPCWQYWFNSPWRVITVLKPHSDHWSIKLFFDIRKPADSKRLAQTLQDLDSKKHPYQVERFTSFPRSEFPTYTEKEIRRIDPAASGRPLPPQQ